MLSFAASPTGCSAEEHAWLQTKRDQHSPATCTDSSRVGDHTGLPSLLPHLIGELPGPYYIVMESLQLHLIEELLSPI